MRPSEFYKRFKLLWPITNQAVKPQSETSSQDADPPSDRSVYEKDASDPDGPATGVGK